MQADRSRRPVGFGVLYLGFAVLFLALGLVTRYMNAGVEEQARAIAKSDVPIVMSSISLLEEMGDMHSNLLEYALGEADEVAEFEKNRREFGRFYEELRQASRPGDVTVATIKRLGDTYMEGARSRVIDRVGKAPQQEVLAAIEQLEHGPYADLEDILDELAKSARQEAVQSLGQLESLVSTSETVLWVSLAVALGLAGLITGFAAHATRKLVGEQAQRARLQKEMGIAHSIQRDLLPTQAIHAPGFEVAAFTRAAEDAGGDFYDWYQLPDGRWVITIADVTGHGIGPALVAASCRSYARSSIPTAESIENAFARINAMVHADLTSGRFVTFAASLIDPATGEAHLLSAGHGPVLHYRAADRSIKSIQPQGLPLGILEDSLFDGRTTLQLQAGDFVAMLTDGFHEWPNAADEQFGIERLCDALTEAADYPAERMIDHVRRRTEQFVGRPEQDDDLTMVVIKRVATEG